ncbi:MULTISPECIES: nuclease A inhibitor family protein [Nostoc]|uniref:Nuclease A inhibitor family protein n=1 Tax=Nostoc paludosum FACHB-159 TaxID=2692908 RepID=A0ABR8KGA3_9NOSO|nr:MULTISPECIES: nuclease A inhibitor family protein [Nostoc]MBD2680848.1 nuclease A inhibitor family protein [Nostoc sp. FACHB-857]MBD2737325.1 nuclease A inhibitor family protein [Nostoc paludosum FACHB-159]
MTNEIAGILKQSSADLLMMSESDYPFEVVFWTGPVDSLTTQKLLQLTNHPSDSQVEEVGLDYFFRNCAYEKEWHDDQQKENVKKFQTLVQTLRNNLNEIKVYRIGTINIDVYILGKTSSGDLAGLSTKVVET